MPGTILLDDLHDSITQQLGDYASQLGSAAQQAIQPVPLIPTPQMPQGPDPNAVLAELQQHAQDVQAQAQQAAQPALQVLGQGAQAAGGAVTQLGGQAQQAQQQLANQLVQHAQDANDTRQQLQDHAATVLGATDTAQPAGVQSLAVPKPAPVLGAVTGDQSTPALGATTGPVNQPETTTAAAAAPPDRSMSFQDYAKAAAARAGIDPNVFTAQIQQESGFNPTAKSPAGAIGIAQFMPDTAKGVGLDPTDPYASLDAAAAEDAKRLQQYQGDWGKTLASYNAGAGAVAQYGGIPPYKETQTYVSTIMGNAQKAADAAGTTISGAVDQAKQAVGNAASALGTTARGALDTASTAMNQSQFGDPQLTSDEAYAACGPAAAVRFAERFGRNPTLREATDLAKQVGWTQQSGMAGLGSEQQLMTNLGIDTKLVGADWSAFAKEAQTGNPVTISTPGHYYFADGYNPDSGAFHVGRSGLDLKGGSEWMTPAQMESLMGPAQGALFANNPTVPAQGADTHSPVTLGGTAGQANAPLTMGANQPAKAPLNVQDQTPTPIQSAQDVLGQAGQAVGGAASALGTAAQGALGTAQEINRIQPGTEAIKAVTPILGQAQQSAQTALGGAAGAVDQVASDLGQAAQGVVSGAAQTAGGAAQAATPVLGGAASAVGTTARGAADVLGSTASDVGAGAQQTLGGAATTVDQVRQQVQQAVDSLPSNATADQVKQVIADTLETLGPQAQNVASTVADLATGGITRRFNENLQGVGQDVQNAASGLDLNQGVKPLTSAAASGLESAAQNVPGNVPVLAGALGIGAALLRQPGVLDSLQTTQELNDKYADSPGAQKITDRNGQSIVLHVDSAVMTPADRQAYDQAAMVIGSVSGQTEREGGTPTPEPGARATGPEPAAIPTNPYDLPRAAPEPNATPLSNEEVLSHLERLDQQHTQNATRIADLQNQAARGTAAPADRVELARLQTDQAQLDAAHNSIWDHAGSGGDVYAQPAAEGLPLAGGVDAGAAQAPGGVAPANAEATGIRGEAGACVPGAYGASEPAARAEPAPAELASEPPLTAAEQSVATPQSDRSAGGSSPELDKLNAMYDGKKPAPAASIPDRIQQVGDSLTRAFTDRQVDINRAQERYAANLGRPLRGDEMAAELQRLASDPVAQVKVDEGLKPAIQSVGSDYPALRNYVTLRSNIEVADNLASRTGNADVATNRLFSGGLNREQSVKALQDLEAQLGPERFARVQAAADQVTAFNNDLRQRLVRAGVLDEGTAAQLEAQYPNWAKTRILDYMADPAGGQGAGTKLGLSDRGLREYTLKGTDQAREDPIASTVAYAHQVERMSMKNEAFQAFLKIDQAGENPMLREVPQSYTPKSNETTMIGFLDGQKTKYVTDNKALGAAINGASGLSTPEWTSAWQKVFRSLATSRNPLFLAGNAALDIPTYVLRSSVREGGPQALPRILGELASGYADAFKGLLQGELQGEGSAEFLKGGGGQSGYFTGGEGQTKRAIAEMQRKNVFQIDGWQDLGRLTKDLLTLHPVEALGERIEMGPRVAAMRLAQRRGANPTQAIIDGRTVTVDFSQGGTVTKYLNNFIPFFNVGFQGPAQIARSFRENPRAFVATVGTLIGIPSAAAEVWNRSDPQRAKDYADVPQYVKDQGIVVMLPGEAPVDQQGNRKPMYALIKLREWMPFATIAREATDRALGDDSRSWQEMASSTLSGVSPIQAQNVAQAGTEPLGGIPILPAAAQIAMNTDFFRGRTIVTQRADQNASVAAKALTPAIQAIVDRAGINAEIRPSAIDFLIRNQGAGVGGAALGASDLAAGQSSDSAGATGLPGVGGLIGRFAGNQTGNELQQARDNSLSAESRDALRTNGITTTPGPVSSSVNQIPLKLDEETKYQQAREPVHRPGDQAHDGIA